MGNGIYAARCGRMVTLIVRGGSGWGPTATSNGWSWGDTLPEKYRPIKTITTPWVTPGATPYGTAVVYADGHISVAKSYGADTKFYGFTVTYPAAA